MSTESPASHQAGGASSCPDAGSAGGGPDPWGMTEVLRTLLAPVLSDEEARAAAVRASRLVLPALTTLGALRPLLGPWDGIVHRRCRLAATGPRVHEGPPALPLAGRGTADQGLRADGIPVWSAPAGGWRTLRVRTSSDGCEVTHWLARRDGDRPAPTAVPTAPSTPVPAEYVLCPEPHGRTGWSLLLRPADVAGWARATGDRNALHLVAGAGARAGLAVGAADVVAHGTLLAALSLAAVPTAAADLRFVAPAAVPPRGVRVQVVACGDVVSAGGVLLRRR